MHMLTGHCILDSRLAVSAGIRMYNPLDKQPFEALLTGVSHMHMQVVHICCTRDFAIYRCSA